MEVVAVGEASGIGRPRAGTMDEATSLSVRPPAAGGEKVEAEAEAEAVAFERDGGVVSGNASAGMMPAGDMLANEEPSRADPFFELFDAPKLFFALFDAELFFALAGEPTGEEARKSRAGMMSFGGSRLLLFFFLDSDLDAFAKARAGGSSSYATAVSEPLEWIVIGESDRCSAALSCLVFLVATSISCGGGGGSSGGTC